MLKDIFQKFFVFRGRLGRWQFFKYTLITYIVFSPLFYWGYVGISEGNGTNISSLALALALGFLVWSNISIQMRRFHDLEKSGLWVVLNFFIIPGSMLSMVAGWALSVWLLIFKGTDGPNQYGEDPLKKS